jgi:hypothetical protein
MYFPLYKQVVLSEETVFNEGAGDTDPQGTGSFRNESRSPLFPFAPGRFALIPVRPGSFRPYSRSPRVVSPSFINTNSAFKK